MKGALLDDDVIFLEKFVRLVKEDSDIEFDVFSDEKKFLKILMEKYYDIIFLDIELNTSSGLEIANKIQNDYANTMIIFLTNQDKYVFDSFGKNVIAYILKSQLEEKLQSVIAKAKKECLKNEVVLLTSNGFIRIEKKEIDYIEIILGKIFLWKENGIKIRLLYRSIAEVIRIINSENFYLINRSIYINLNKIIRISKLNVFIQGYEFPFEVSKYKKHELLEKYMIINMRKYL